ncbi:MAG: hypothetical protein O2798_11220 [Chloroflexi bacterium]|nr:hypothetical protein [Chloroflexota bacterium]MDA1241391.1 hypothetical protein [Chloroflexota bacterium]
MEEMATSGSFGEPPGMPVEALRGHTTDEILHALHAVMPASRARSLLSRARRVAGLHRNDDLAVDEMLLLCSALAAEGGLIEQIASDLARRALDAPMPGRGRSSGR